MKSLKPNFKTLLFFLTFGLVFIYTSCINCNCDDYSKTPQILTGTYKDSSISSKLYSPNSARFNNEIFNNDTLKENEIYLNIYLLEKWTAQILQKPVLRNGGYNLYACDCVGPQTIDNSIKIKDTITHIDIITLNDIGNQFKKNDVLNDSLFIGNLYNLAIKNDSSITDFNQKGIIPKNEYFKIKFDIKSITPIQFKVIVTTKKGNIYQDTTDIAYIKP